MGFIPLSSMEVVEFLPIDTWTEIDLYPSDFKNVYIATTKDKIEKREKNMKLMSLYSNLFDKITKFKKLEIVGVQINGEWLRGRLISYNEFITENTKIELMDVGSTYSTKLENLFRLPYYHKYEPLVLPITFKDFIPKTTTICIKPLMIESDLSKGVVLVTVNCNNINLENDLNEKHQLKSIKNFNSTNDSKMITVENMTNCHYKTLDNNDSSLYLSKSFRKGSFSSLKTCNNLPFKNKDCCIITFFEDFTCLYVSKAMIQLKDDGTMIYSLCDRYLITDTYNGTDKVHKYDPVMGDIVKVFSSLRQGFFRAKILKNNNNGSYNIFYIDYGNIETVPSNVIYELADELKKPGLAVRIRLRHLKRTIITNKIKTMFDEFSDNEKPFIIEFDGKTNNCLDNVKLKDIENESFINHSYIMQFTK